MADAAPAPAPAAAPAAAPTPAAAPAPATPESLIHNAPAPAAPAPKDGLDTDPFAWVPEKFRVQGEDGKLDITAAAKKIEEARAHLEQRLGSGDAPPKTAAEYAFQLPEEFKDFELKSERLEAFKNEALQHGITGKQFEFMMGQYLKAVPDLMEGAAKLTADQARAELSKTWAQPQQMEQGLSNATRALRALPPELQDATAELGTNPAFLRAMAHLGAQMREDTPPSNPNPAAPAGDVQTLMRSEAFMNPKHPDHARVSAQVRSFYERTHGTQPI